MGQQKIFLLQRRLHRWGPWRYKILFIIIMESFLCDTNLYLFPTDADESDAERAELELKEALAIQQRMAEQLDEGDFGLDFITHLKVNNHLIYLQLTNFNIYYSSRLLIKLRDQRNHLSKKWKLMSTFHSCRNGKNSSCSRKSPPNYWS